MNRHSDISVQDFDIREIIIDVMKLWNIGPAEIIVVDWMIENEKEIGVVTFKLTTLFNIIKQRKVQCICILFCLTGNPTQRVKLISTPVSKNWTFGKDG